MAAPITLDDLARDAEQVANAEAHLKFLYGVRDGKIRKVAGYTADGKPRYTKGQIAEAAGVSDARVRQVLAEDGNDPNANDAHAAST